MQVVFMEYIICKIKPNDIHVKFGGHPKLKCLQGGTLQSNAEQHTKKIWIFKLQSRSPWYIAKIECVNYWNL